MDQVGDHNDDKNWLDEIALRRQSEISTIGKNAFYI